MKSFLTAAGQAIEAGALVGLKIGAALVIVAGILYFIAGDYAATRTAAQRGLDAYNYLVQVQQQSQQTAPAPAEPEPAK